MKVVLDTNVLVSALLNPLGPPARVLQLLRSSENLTLLTSNPVIQEYREVLPRPRFGIDEMEVDELLSFLDRIGEWMTPPSLEITIPDPDDLPFLELAVAGGATALITGNMKDFGKQFQQIVMSPVQFLGFFKK